MLFAHSSECGVDIRLAGVKRRRSQILVEVSGVFVPVHAPVILRTQGPECGRTGRNPAPLLVSVARSLADYLDVHFDVMFGPLRFRLRRVVMNMDFDQTFLASNQANVV